MFVVHSISEIGGRIIGKTECFYSVYRGLMVADESLCNKITRIVNRLLWLWEMWHNREDSAVETATTKTKSQQRGTIIGDIKVGVGNCQLSTVN
ncbi:hypothetical protein QUA24_16780 [Microcoleus sp. Pol12B5]